MPAGQQVEVDEHEQVVERVAAIDVAKASGMVCTRMPHATQVGRRVTRVWQVGSTTNQILELAEQLAGQGIERVVVESTSDDWRPFVDLLEARGLVVWLVNARDVKHLPGRPTTDQLDAVWLARLNERGMLRPSFVPSAQIRRLREDTRLRADLTVDRSRHKQRLEQAAGRRPDQAVHGGHRHLWRLGPGHAGGADRRAARPQGAGRAGAGSAARQPRRPGGGPDRPLRRPPCRAGPHAVGPDRHLGEQIQRLTARIEQTIGAIPAAQPPAPAPGPGADAPASTRAETESAGSGPGHPDSDRVDPQTGELLAAPLPVMDRLDEVAGIGGHAAQVIIAELGLDMGQFPPRAAGVVGQAVTADHPVRRHPPLGRHRQGQPYLKGVLGEAAAAAAKTDTFCGERYRRLVRRIGKLKALVAVARSILVIVWHLLADPTARFRDLGADYHTRRLDTTRKTRNLVRQLEALGHKVTLQPAA